MIHKIIRNVLLKIAMRPVSQITYISSQNYHQCIQYQFRRQVSQIPISTIIVQATSFHYAIYDSGDAHCLQCVLTKE